MRELRTYRIISSSGAPMTVQLTPETAARDYPNAVELKVGVPEIKDAPKTTRRRAATKKD